jgi:anionic cell wall polymer biosynthesis LytR-Cps2A-Psr (LCP) family protein
MVSLPRDLVVNMSGYINKINSVMAFKYNKTKDIDEAAKALANKAQEITSLPIPYYALIDFNGFSDLVDAV